ncbi:hypothetical protein KXD40_001293 [Peronospora effusa]|uniref:Uncharacterized protein n=1 Tax=Peronospora effusa TaxID=542832 RepID=A0A3M6VLT8_9STRA|nr:hypothetical protein DD238_000309 [Peronospora effusa]RQM18073.1 hypothetical protein DD237_000433 [Peronospora effusa]UIZ20822.1 hypothetical protein KXD40_001293 [Peronospora effusa]
MEDTAAPRVELDEAAVRPPRYGVPTPDSGMIFAKGPASFSLPSTRGESRRSASNDMDSRSSFLIAAVAENRAREIGNVSACIDLGFF